MVTSCMMLGMLGIEAFQDVRSRKIGVWLICAFGICGVFCHLIFQKGEYRSLLGGIAIGAAMMLVSVLTRGRVGLGDGMVLFVTGIFLGFEQNLMLFAASQMLTACFALFLFVFRKKGKSYEIPFIPFLLVSYVGLLAL